MENGILRAKFSLGQKIYNINNKKSGTVKEILIKRFDEKNYDDIPFTYFEIRYMVQSEDETTEWCDRVMRSFPKENTDCCDN